MYGYAVAWPAFDAATPSDDSLNHRLIGPMSGSGPPCQERWEWVYGLLQKAFENKAKFYAPLTEPRV